MAIDPRLLQAPGDVPQIYTTVSDLDRRVRQLEAARSVVGAGTITGGTGGMIGSGTITGGNVGSGTITGTNIVAGTITATQIQAGSITATLIAADAINAGHIQAGAVTASEIAANTITAANIQAGTITSTEIQAGSIIAADIQAHTLTANEIAANTITTTEILAGTILASDISAGTITSTQIAATTITAANIAAGTITATQIATGTITGSLIAGATITGSNLVSGTITATQIGVSSLSAISANMGTITAGTVTGATFQTSGSNPRVIMDSTSLRTINAAGTTTFAADAATGKITTLAGLGSGNVIVNSSFEDENAPTVFTTVNTVLPGWQRSASGSEHRIFKLPTLAQHGSFVLSARRASGSGAGTITYEIVPVARPVASPGQVWAGSFFFQPTASTLTARVRIAFFDAAGALVGSATTGPTVSCPPGVWTRATLEQVIAPALTASVRMTMDAPGSVPELEDCYFDNAQLEVGGLVTGYAPKPDEVSTNAVVGSGPNVNVPLTTTNLAPNPSSETAAAFTQMSASSAGQPAATITLTKDWAAAGLWSCRYQVTRTDGGAVTVRTADNFATVTPGRYYAARVRTRLRSTCGALDFIGLDLNWFQAGGAASAVDGSDTGYLIATPTVNYEYDLLIIAQAPSDATTVSIRPRFDPTTGTVLVDADVDAIGLFDLGTAWGDTFTEASTRPADVPAYFDGSFPNCSWSGTAHASTSSKFYTPGAVLSNSITGTDIVARSILAHNIQASTITSVEIAANTITAGNIAAGTITAVELAAGSVTATKINVSALSAITANMGAVTAGTISGVTITGGTVQTSSVGARVVLTTGGFSAYNSSNALVVSIPTAGQAQFIGALDAAGGLTQDAITASPPPASHKHAWQDSSDSEIAAIFGATSAFPGAATQRLMASATAPMSYTTLVKAHANLKHYWKLNSDASATDSVTSGALTLTPTSTGSGVPVLATGLISGTDSAIKNAATTSWAVFSNATTPTETVTTGLSLEYWVRFAALPKTDVRFITRSDNPDGSTAEYYKATYIASTGKLQFSVLIGGVAKTHTSATTVVANTTYHVVHTYDGANLRTYLNGAADGTAVAQTGSIDAQGTTDFFVGMIRAAEESIGPTFPTTTATQASGNGLAWTSPGNILSSNNVYATANSSNGAFTDWLAAGGFGFTVPTGALVAGLTVDPEIKSSINTFSVSIEYAARTDYTTTTGQAIMAGQWDVTTSDASGYLVGGPADSWGRTWTVSEANSASFGVAIRISNPGGTAATFSVDAIRVTIQYVTQITLDEVATYSAALAAGVVTDHYQTGVTGISTSTTSITKSIIGADSSSDFVIAKGEHVKVGKNATTACANAADTLITWNTEFYDVTADGTNAMHDNVTNNSRLTARIAGLYLIHGNWTMSAVGAGRAAVVKNGAGVLANGSRLYLGPLAGPTTYAEVEFQTVAQLAAGDYVEAFMRNDSGGSRNVVATSNEVGYFGMSRIGTTT